MKAIPIIWQDSHRKPEHQQEFRKHIVLIGTFHVIKITGSGYAEIITETNLTTSGCLNRVLRGKQFNRSVWCLKIVCEAMERLLLDVFVQEMSEPAQGDVVLNTLISLISDHNKVKLDEVLADSLVL
ncbi:hypothetical protein ElyMa_006502000 [Elysia marginata]|uniref:Uncharacterized protein n=1 Tax=Elysia marginata TaxID=1093978 RepID=A0AAV4I2E7_9GAST|nr:hypothetical protein ElyMa_006502000 [Elysia marginata]